MLNQEDFKSRWIPCMFCGVRVKLYSYQDQFDTVTWLHSPSDEEPHYGECNADELLATPIGVHPPYRATPFINTPLRLFA